MPGDPGRDRVRASAAAAAASASGGAAAAAAAAPRQTPPPGSSGPPAAGGLHSNPGSSSGSADPRDTLDESAGAPVWPEAASNGSSPKTTITKLKRENAELRRKLGLAKQKVEEEKRTAKVTVDKLRDELAVAKGAARPPDTQSVEHTWGVPYSKAGEAALRAERRVEAETAVHEYNSLSKTKATDSKAIFTAKDRINTYCAMLNSGGGFVHFGIEKLIVSGGGELCVVQADTKLPEASAVKQRLTQIFKQFWPLVDGLWDFHGFCDDRGRLTRFTLELHKGPSPVYFTNDEDELAYYRDGNKTFFMTFEARAKKERDHARALLAANPLPVSVRALLICHIAAGKAGVIEADHEGASKLKLSEIRALSKCCASLHGGDSFWRHRGKEALSRRVAGVLWANAPPGRTLPDFDRASSKFVRTDI